jgi:hypothetical protein
MNREQQQELHTMPPEEQLAAMGLTPEPKAEPGTRPTGQEADLPDLPPDQQLAAMGLAPEPEAEPGTEPTGQEADLPSLPVGQQLAAMGLASQPETELATESGGLIEPEMEAYEAERAKEEAPATTRGGRKPRKPT